MPSSLVARQQALLGLGQTKHGYSVARLLLVVLIHAAVICARPLTTFEQAYKKESDVPDEPRSPEDAKLWIYLAVALALVLLGGAFAGLTIALMGQDEIYLQVIAESGEGSEKKAATKVLHLLKKGKHWVLVTLLVGNVITNETLPIVLDRSIGGGYAAAISSTVLVIIFGEIVPQSICVRFGLPIGAACAPFVLVLMWLFAPVSWPIAKLLDYLLGEDHGTTYKKAGLKTLVTLHKSLGDTPGERLNEDEVSIISGVLDLKEKPVGQIMTPIADVFTLPSDAVLDEEMMDDIMREGYSRIPIHQPNNNHDFVGMLLVKMLITYDPEDHKRVNEFSLATLPETRPETSCLDIINFFQEGKSHMVLVSDRPGETQGAMGVVTLEDVIEELIGEEIVDESDVLQDVHKAIRRNTPAPVTRGRVNKGEVVEGLHSQADVDEGDIESETQPLLKADNNTPSYQGSHRPSAISLGENRAPRSATFLMRRKSSGSGSTGMRTVQMNRNSYTAEQRDQLRKLGPSNLASRPKQTRVNTIRIKPAVSTILEHPSANVPATVAEPSETEAQTGIGEGTLTPGLSAKDGVQALSNGFEPYDKEATPERRTGNRVSLHAFPDAPVDLMEQAEQAAENSDLPRGFPETHVADGDNLPDLPDKAVFDRVRSAAPDAGSVGGGLPSGASSPKYSRHSHHRKPTGATRSGSITESFVDAGGVRKLVLETVEHTNEDEAESAVVITEAAEIEESSGNATSTEDQKNGTSNGAGAAKPKLKKKKKKAKKPSQG